MVIFLSRANSIFCHICSILALSASKYMRNFVFLEMTSNSTYFENSRHYYFEIPFFSSYCSLGIHNCQCDRDVCTLNDVLKLDFLVSPPWCHFASHYLSKIFLCGIFMCVQIYRTFLNKGAINILMTRDSIFNILSILYMWLPSVVESIPLVLKMYR